MVLDDLWRKAGHELTNAEYRYVIGGKGNTPPDDIGKLLKANEELHRQHRTPKPLK